MELKQDSDAATLVEISMEDYYKNNVETKPLFPVNKTASFVPIGITTVAVKNKPVRKPPKVIVST